MPKLGSLISQPLQAQRPKLAASMLSHEVRQMGLIKQRTALAHLSAYCRFHD